MSLVRRLVSVLLVALSVAARVGEAQEATVRFPIVRVDDSTFVFPTGDHRWVAAGQRGIAVDGRRQDALVARFLVMRVVGTEATALVAGQTTVLTPDHVALLVRPPDPWYRERGFWTGLVLGAFFGAIIARL